MSSTTCRRLVAALALIASLFLLAPPARAATPYRDADSFVTSARGGLAAWWGLLSSLWGEHGLTADPDGAPAASGGASPTPLANVWGEHGASADPDGAPAGSGQSEQGVTADPNG